MSPNLIEVLTPRTVRKLADAWTKARQEAYLHRDLTKSRFAARAFLGDLS